METTVTTDVDALTLGNRLAGEGDLKGALLAFDAGLASQPDDAALLRQRCGVLLSLGRMSEAVQAYDELLRLDPSDLQALLGKGEALAGQHDRAALPCFEQAKALDPHNPAIPRRKAVACRRLGLQEEALESYRQALAMEPGDALSLRGKGDQLAEMERYPEAFESYCEAARLTPDVMNGAEWAMRGEALLRLQKAEPALLLFQIAVSLEPSYLPSWSGLARAQNQSGHAAEAFKTVNQVLAQHPDNQTFLTEKGSLLLQERRFEEAVDCYDLVLKGDAVNWVAWANKGAALHNLGRYQEANASYDKALELDPQNGDIWPYKGVCLEELGKQAEALVCYDKALAINPTSFVALNNKGWLLAQQDSFEEAFDYLDRAIKQNQAEQTPWLNKAVTLRRLGKIDEALACARAAVAVVDDRRRLLNFCGMLLSDYKEDHESALIVYRQVEQLDPGSLENQACLAEVLLKLRRYQEGRQLAEHLAETAEDSFLRAIARFLVLVSFAFDGSVDQRNRSFSDFIAAFREVAPQAADAPRVWIYSGLTRCIRQSDLPAEVQFELLSLIDLQSGTIRREQCSFLQLQS